MNHALEKQLFRDLDGWKKSVSISEADSNLGKKLDPILKRPRKAIFAAPPSAQHMYIKTGKIDQLR